VIDPRSGKIVEYQHRGPNERVIARPHILQIHHEHIDGRHVVGLGREIPEAFAMKTTDRRPECIAGVGDADHVLRFFAVATFGAEDEDDARERCRGAPSVPCQFAGTEWCS
jgi:hypothetical protein